MKKLISVSCSFFILSALHAQLAGIGTSSPKSELHLHSGTSSFSLQMTNNITSDAANRGFQQRLLGGNMYMQNQEAGGNIYFETANTNRLSILANGNLGVGTFLPAHKLHIINGTNANALEIEHLGNGNKGLNLSLNGINSEGIVVTNPQTGSYGSPTNYVTGVHAKVGTGAMPYNITTLGGTYAIVGESLGITEGYGVLGISHAPSVEKTMGALVGYNYSTGENAYAVVGISTGNSGAGVIGHSLTQNTAGVLGYGQGSHSTAMKAELVETVSTNGTALEIKNGPIRVTGVHKTAFQITAAAGNINNNLLVIPNTTLASNPTDLLIVTPVYGATATYCNFPIGVWWNGSNWTIFNQNGPTSTMPTGATFNVLVIKQ
ncbi:MAG: hypothetical protein WAT19_17170 [Ferruginibacter sp.]